MPPGRPGFLDDDNNGDPDEMSIHVNEEFAKRFEHNKRREELHRLQSKHPHLAAKLAAKEYGTGKAGRAGGGGRHGGDDDDTDSDEDEEEDEGEIPEDTERQILETLLKIRQKAPEIYQPDKRFFAEPPSPSTQGQEEGDGEGKRSKSKPMYLKDVIARQALEHGAELGSDDDSDGGGRHAAEKRPRQAYDPEQEDLRKAFLEAAAKDEEQLPQAEGDEGFGVVLRCRSGASSGPGPGSDSEGAAADRKQSKKKGKKGKKEQGGEDGEKDVDKLLDAYFGADEAPLSAADKFLKHYIASRAWVDERASGKYVPTYKEIVGEDDGMATGADELGGSGAEDVDVEEDEEYLEQADRFEAAYNFRFEEPGSAAIVGHPRVIKDTVRKADDRRKRARAEVAARKEEEASRHQHEVRRLKNLKKAEIEERLASIREVAGVAAPAADIMANMLEGDFDPEAWDKQMAAAFDDEYYQAEEDLADQELAAVGGLDDDDDHVDVGIDNDDGGPLSGGSGLDTEDIDGDDEGDGKAKDGGAAGRAAFKKLRKQLAEIDRKQAELEAAAAASTAEGEAGEGDGEKKRAKLDKKKTKLDIEALARERAEVQRLLEEYYRLDYEDEVGGIKTRFRYKQVEPAWFGLSANDILRLSEKELNQIAGMKTLAPYRDEAGGRKQRPNYKALQAIKGEAAARWRDEAAAGGRKPRDKRGFKHEGRLPHSGQHQQRWQPRPQQQDHRGDGRHVPSHKHAGQRQANGHAEGARPQREGKSGAAQGAVEPPRGKDEAGQAQAKAIHNGSAKPAAKEEGKGKGRQHKHKPKQQEAVDPAQARLASYAKLTLSSKKDGGTSGQQGGKGKSSSGKQQQQQQQQQGQKRKGSDGGGDDNQRKKQKQGQQQQQQPSSAGSELTKAQRKNMKRAVKRAARHVPVADGAAA